MVVLDGGTRVEAATRKARDAGERVPEVAVTVFSYRDECRTLETFLEEESGKKEKEIRKLKEEAINK